MKPIDRGATPRCRRRRIREDLFAAAGRDTVCRRLREKQARSGPRRHAPAAPESRHARRSC
jgi:hypothetical protein